MSKSSPSPKAAEADEVVASEKVAPVEGGSKVTDGNRPSKKNETKRGGNRGSYQRTYASVTPGEAYRASGGITFTVFTIPGVRSVEDAVQPAAWLYRELVGSLASGGYSGAIGPVNDLVNLRITTVIEIAEETREKMDRAVRRHAERLGAEIAPRNRGTGHTVKMVSVGGITTRMIEMVKGIDEAVTACELATSVDAVPYEVGQNAIGEIIAHNRVMLTAVKKMREVVMSKSADEKINVDELMRLIRGRVEKSVMDRSANLGLKVEREGVEVESAVAREADTEEATKPKAKAKTKTKPKSKAKTKAGAKKAAAPKAETAPQEPDKKPGSQLNLREMLGRKQ